PAKETAQRPMSLLELASHFELPDLLDNGCCTMCQSHALQRRLSERRLRSRPLTRPLPAQLRGRNRLRPATLVGAVHPNRPGDCGQSPLPYGNISVLSVV